MLVFRLAVAISEQQDLAAVDNNVADSPEKTEVQPKGRTAFHVIGRLDPEVCHVDCAGRLSYHYLLYGIITDDTFL